ncbi:IS630 family transposase [Leptolyngbya sp. FACHB-541]|uniref:IS630 family transposase n=1 Tax=Leptolyngbya sp. FACHB-541 TaxID=2692810 RepID=UPI0018EFC473|nr:IS630 family transposase [Leptolyngbya sp. FACHB-541]
MPQRVEQLRQAYPQAQVEVWAFDEHRLGLKPIIRKVWAKRGQRPSAVVHHRYQWLYLYAFVCPHSGQSEWLILPRVSVTWFNQALQVFAQAVGAGGNKQLLLIIDGAGWHRAKQVVVPEGIHLEFLPPYSPELQPAERLWQLSDEPLVNRKFDNLDALEETLASRCLTLSAMPQTIRGHTLFHWWKEE